MNRKIPVPFLGEGAAATPSPYPTSRPAGASILDGLAQFFREVLSGRSICIVRASSTITTAPLPAAQLTFIDVGSLSQPSVIPPCLTHPASGRRGTPETRPKGYPGTG